MFTKVKVTVNKVSYGYVALANMEVDKWSSYYGQSSDDSDDYTDSYGETMSENHM